MRRRKEEEKEEEVGSGKGGEYGGGEELTSGQGEGGGFCPHVPSLKHQPKK